MKLIAKYLSLVALGFIGFKSGAQSFSFRKLANADGLSQSQVLCITQDKKGFLWVGTSGGGLNRFDGQSFEVYTTYEGLPDDVIHSVCSDAQGSLWIGTSTGLARLLNGKFEKFSSYNGLDDDRINSIDEDKMGNIWVATANTGVSVYNQKRFKSFGIKDGLGFSECSKLYCCANGDVFIGSTGYGLTMYRNNRFFHFSNIDGFKAYYVYSIDEDKDGNVYIMTELGIYTYNGKKFRLHQPQDLPMNRTSSLMIDSQNRQWISTYGMGVALIEKDKLNFYSRQNGLGADDVICSFEDRNGNYWLGTNGQGLLHFTGEAFQRYDQQAGLSGINIKSLEHTRKGELYVGTNSGIDKISADNTVSLFYSGSNLFNCIHLYADSKENLWASFENGFGYFNPEGTFSQLNFIPPTLTINGVLEDHNGTIWLATNDGVYNLKSNGIYRRLVDSIPKTDIYKLKPSVYHKNAFWICSDAGLVLYDGTYIRSVKIKSPSEHIDVYDLWEDPVGKLWVITNRGLCHIDKSGNKKWYNRHTGLSSNNLSSIEYFRNSLWIGNDKGIDQVILDRSYQLNRIEFVGKNKGFPGQEINRFGSVKFRDRLYFATINGLILYDPYRYKVSNDPPSVYISEIAMNYQKVNWANVLPDVKLYDGLPQNAIFEHYQNYFTFYFNPIDFNSPNNIRIQYQLEGLDTAWINVGTERQATYANLAYGSYNFKVRATSNGVTWGNISSFRFTISAPFWRRSWFFMLLIPFVLISGYTVSRFQNRRLRKSRERLKLKVDERTRELKFKNDELEKLSIVASQTNDGVLICDNTGKILFLNEGFKRMTVSDISLFDSSVYNKKYLQELSSQNNIKELIRQIAETGRSVTYESTHQLPDGNLMWTNASLTPIFENNVLNRIIVIYTNITDRVITEHALIQTNKDITDSIHYAKKIQEAILPSRQILKNNFPESFIYYSPRDIVSGDFYWFARVKNHFVIACADCTGHGVPGAMMTMIGNEFLHQIINNAMVIGPDNALNLLDKHITRALHNDNRTGESKDGMDIALCSINLDTLHLIYSGANIPLYVVSGEQMREYNGIKTAIGSVKSESESYFPVEVQLNKGDMIYMSTDGYVDQLGGERGRKFMRKNFKELLISISSKPLETQENLIKTMHLEHKGNLPQTDDVMVIGLRI